MPKCQCGSIEAVKVLQKDYNYLLMRVECPLCEKVWWEKIK